jgi:hypothetical protein
MNLGQITYIATRLTISQLQAQTTQLTSYIYDDINTKQKNAWPTKLYTEEQLLKSHMNSTLAPNKRKNYSTVSINYLSMPLVGPLHACK